MCSRSGSQASAGDVPMAPTATPWWPAVVTVCALLPGVVYADWCQSDPWQHHVRYAIIASAAVLILLHSIPTRSPPCGGNVCVSTVRVLREAWDSTVWPVTWAGSALLGVIAVQRVASAFDALACNNHWKMLRMLFPLCDLAVGFLHFGYTDRHDTGNPRRSASQDTTAAPPSRRSTRRGSANGGSTPKPDTAKPNTAKPDATASVGLGTALDTPLRPPVQPYEPYRRGRGRTVCAATLVLVIRLIPAFVGTGTNADGDSGTNNCPAVPRLHWYYLIGKAMGVDGVTIAATAAVVMVTHVCVSCQVRKQWTVFMALAALLRLCKVVLIVINIGSVVPLALARLVTRRMNNLHRPVGRYVIEIETGLTPYNTPSTPWSLKEALARVEGGVKRVQEALGCVDATPLACPCPVSNHEGALLTVCLSCSLEADP